VSSAFSLETRRLVSLREQFLYVNILEEDLEEWMRPISLAHLTVLDADPVGLIEAGKEGGFDAIGLRVVPPLATDTIIPVVGDVPLQRRIKEALRATGMQILDIEAVWIQPDTDVGSLRSALEVGADLGAQYVLTVGFDEERGRLLENFGAFCALAQSCGLRTMLEFIPYATIGTLAQAHELLAEVAPADAGLLVDALHLSRSGGHPRDIAKYDPALFSYIHLCDAPAIPPSHDKLRPEARGGRLYPGEGQLWLMEFLDAFPGGTPVAVEAPDASLSRLPVAERACRAAQATRDLLRRHNGRVGAP
jgi:sugar phosphate isomerase/epimerase